MAGAFWQFSSNGGLANGSDTLIAIGTGGMAEGDFFAGPTKIKQPGTIDNFTVQLLSNTRASATTFEVAVNGSPSGTSVVLPAGSVGPVQSTLPVSVLADDTVTVIVTVGGFEPSNFYAIESVGCRFTATDATKTVSLFTANSNLDFSAQKYVAIVGQIVAATTEVETTFRPGEGGHAGSLSKARVLIGGNSCTGTSAIKVRVAGADAITISIPSGNTGWIENNVDTSDLDGSQSVNWSVEPNGGTLNVRVMHVDYTTADGSWTSGIGQQARGVTASATADLSIGGRNDVTGPQELPFGTRIVSIGIYIDCGAQTSDTTLEWITDGVASGLYITIPAGETGIFEVTGRAPVNANDPCLLRLTTGSGSGGVRWCIWFVGMAASLDGAIGPYVWVHEARKVGNDTAIDTYSDHDMACPHVWENGFKEARILSWGTAERRLSHPWTGEWTGSQFQYTKSDYDRRFREQFVNVNRYWGLRVVKMTDRPTRAQLADPYTIFVGPMIDATPSRPLSWDITLSDRISQALITDDHQIPWRYARDGIIGHLDTVSQNFDLETPEPIIYGDHRRVPDVDVASPQGFLFAPIYLGVKSSKHQFLVAGHACKSIPDIYVDDGTSVTSITADIGAGWTVPGHGGSPTEPLYVDYTSATYPGQTRRYCVIQGDVGNADADACAAGEKTLLCSIQGIEDVGDGSGDCITDRLLQYKHFVINFVVNFGPDSYQSGNWLVTPAWDVLGIDVPMVDEDSFDLASSIAATRYPIRLPRPGGGTYSEGYIGAAVIGARAGDRASVKRWIAEWNRSCGTQCGFTRVGKYRVTMLHPTQADKDAAPLFTDATEIVAGTFGITVGWQDQAISIPWRNDYEARTGIWKTTGLEQDTTAITNYGREIRSEQKEYPMAPGVTMGTELARRELAQRTHPQRFVMISASVGPDPDAKALAHLDLGDWVRYRHFASVGTAADEIRLGQIVRHQVQPGKRYVLAEVLDCDDLIDFDAPQTLPATSPENTTCDGAIDVTPASLPMAPYVVGVNTALDPTDHSVDGLLPGSPTPTAYCARWWKITAPDNGHLFVNTYSSDYDTQIAYFTGSCGSLSLMTDGYNNDDTVLGLTSSVLDLAVTSGTTVYILAAAYTSTGGNLRIGINFYIPE